MSKPLDDPVSARLLAMHFAALGHEARLRILDLLLRAHPSGLVVGEIQDRLSIPSSTLSHHLDALRHAGLVDQAREGRFLRYRALSDELAESLETLLGQLSGEGR